MRDFNDKVAVVTGAANGIGRAIAEHCVAEGMKVVLADVNGELLSQVALELGEAGATVLPILTDVSEATSVENLAQKTIEEFGAVHLLFNNAGVTRGSVATGSLAEWQWVLGVNLWGVIHGVHYFVPIMLEQKEEAHIINTASAAGLIVYGGIYGVSKHAVVGLSEVLHNELTEEDTGIHVSVLCPSAVNTQFIENSVKNRPSEIQEIDKGVTPSEQQLAIRQKVSEVVAAAPPPVQIARITFDAIRNEDFYIIPDPSMEAYIKMRFDGILSNQHPKSVQKDYLGLE